MPGRSSLPCADYVNLSAGHPRLRGFPAGLVIYWAWNNTLSVLQQSFIMRRNGVKVELFDNLKATFAKKAT